MTRPTHILIYTKPESEDLFDSSTLASAGYDVITISESNDLEAKVMSHLGETMLIYAHPSPLEGLRASAKILQAHPSLPVILVTNEMDQSFLKQALEIGIGGYLTKPVDSTSLLNAVEHTLVRQKSRQVDDRYLQVITNLVDGFILTGLNANILLVNQSARNIFNITEGQIEGKAVNEIFYHQDFLDIFKPQRTYPYRNEITMEDGHVYNAQASLIPEIGIAVTMQDITHLKELDRVKTDFVNTISHDLRSPLTSIYGFIGLIDRVGPINKQQAEFIHHIQTSVQHITSLINDLLDLSRVEAGYDPQMVKVNLKDILTRSINGLEYQISEKMQEVVLSVPDDIPEILGNPLHLQRMVGNLIENAIKFTPLMGKIDVRCRTEAGQLLLEVADNGPGISLADQPHIFEKFYRGSNLSQVTSGTGLGLSIVHSIIEKHHGRIWVDSSSFGTTFTVILPLLV
jgi:two-component system phosphate regulon sensor histidine kinase PhoR